MENKELKTFRLIDKEGYFSKNIDNEDLYKRYAVSECFTGYIDTDGDLIHIGGKPDTFIARIDDEFQFFEEVITKSANKNNYWNGVVDLEVGMLVGVLNTECQYKVLLLKTDNVMRTFAVIEDEHLNIYVKPITFLKSLLSNQKEIFCKEVLEEIRSKSVDFAYDTTWDIKEVAALCWDKLEGGIDE